MPTVIGMRTAAAALALGFTLTAAGVASCSGPEGPGVTLTPEPGVTPVYSSDEEALAAAEELYGRYLEISNEIGQDGWGDTDRFAEVMRDDLLASELETSTGLHDKGWTQVGDTTFDSMTLQRLADGGAGSVEMVLYVCGDVSNVDVVDKSGRSVVSDSRPDRQPLEVGMDDSEGALKVNRSDAWSGIDFC